MSLLLWIPGTTDFSNQGIKNAQITSNGVTIDANGKLGNCLCFNNTGHLLGTPAPLSNNSQEWTFACWMKVNASHNGCLFSDRTSTNSTGITIFYYNSQWLIDDGVRWQFTPITAIAANTWYHVCVVRKKGTGKYLYINGVLDSYTSTTGTPKIVSTTHFAIGNSQSSNTSVTGNQFNGYLNDIRVYDKALSPDEIKNISRGLMLHYPLVGTDYKTLFPETDNEQVTCPGYEPDLSSNLLRFNTETATKFNNLILEYKPKQSGAGTPSATNIRPFTVYSFAWVKHRGHNLWHNDDFIVGSVKKDDDGWYYGTAAQFRSPFQHGLFESFGGLNWPQVTISYDYYNNGTTTSNTLKTYYSYSDGTNNYYNIGGDTNGEIVHKTATSTVNKIVNNITYGYNNSRTIYIKNYQIEFGNQATTFSDGIKDDVKYSDVNLYGFVVNVATGTITQTHGHIASYNGESLSGQWMSDRDVYGVGKNPTIGAEVVYELDNPIIIQQSPHEVLSFVGENNFFTNATSIYIPREISGVADPRRNTLGLNDNIERDVSGFLYNGTKYNMFYDNTNPVHNLSCGDFRGNNLVINPDFNLQSGIWSMSFWYYLDQAPTVNWLAISLSRGDGTDANKKIGFFPCQSKIITKIEDVYATINSAPVANQWTHIVITCDGVAGKVYKNGTLAVTAAVSSILDDCTDLVVGGRAASENVATYSSVFDGKISDLRIYATCLSSEDILKLYNGK